MVRGQLNGNNARLQIFTLIRDEDGELKELKRYEPDETDGDEIKSPLLGNLLDGFLRSELDSKDYPKSLFNLGQVVATPGAFELLNESGINPVTLLRRHQIGDWGNFTKGGEPDAARARSRIQAGQFFKHHEVTN